MKGIMRTLHKFEHKAIVKIAALTHYAYYGLVALEAHATYKWAAAGILLVMIHEQFSPENKL